MTQVNQLQVFISWSGDRSKRLAEALDKWLKRVLQNVHPWMSKYNIERGKVWVRELTDALGSIDVGIICITRENKATPWILFEAGALAKKGEARVVPYLLDDGPRDLPAPLQMFNAVHATKEETPLMLRSVNKALEESGLSGLSETDLDATFEKWWPDLESEIKKISESPESPPKSPTADQSLANIDIRLTELSDRLDAISDSVRTLGYGVAPSGGDYTEAYKLARGVLDLVPDRTPVQFTTPSSLPPGMAPIVPDPDSPRLPKRPLRKRLDL